MRHLKLLAMIVLSFLSTVAFAVTNNVLVQDDTVKAQLTAVPPVIDGQGNDACWQEAKWQTIDQVWIPYGGSVPAEDYTGKYKVVWSATENVLYFLVEILDDVFVDGYVYNSDPGSGGGYPNYDIVEVFIDENKSGGLHVFDGTGSTGAQWGTNAENAFSYHITVNCPSDGEVTTECVICDIAGKDWGNYWIPNFATHFPQFALKKTGNTYTWEFSLAVYSDQYDHNNPEASRVQLTSGKIMGLSLAYCENDDPNENPKKRDNFFGSVWVPEAAYNDHWMNADGFGTILLVPESTTDVKTGQTIPETYFHIYPNPSSGDVRFVMSNNFIGDVKIKLYNILGCEIYTSQLHKTQNQLHQLFHMNDVPRGVYIFSTEYQGERMVQKILITDH